MSSNEGYKRLIDGLVEVAKDNVLAARIQQNGHPFHPHTKSKKSDMFLSMTSEQKAMVTQLIEETRSGAVHDVANFLEATIDSEEEGGETLCFFANGEPITESPFGGLTLDFVCRLEGDSWPDE